MYKTQLTKKIINYTINWTYFALSARLFKAWASAKSLAVSFKIASILVRLAIVSFICLANSVICSGSNDIDCLRHYNKKLNTFS